MSFNESHNYGYGYVTEPGTYGENEMAQGKENSFGYPSPLKFPQPNCYITSSYSTYTAPNPVPPYSLPPNLQQPPHQQVSQKAARQSTYKGFGAEFNRDLNKAKKSWPNPIKAIMRLFRRKPHPEAPTHPQPGPSSNPQEGQHVPAIIAFPEPHHTQAPSPFIQVQIRSVQQYNMYQMNGHQYSGNTPY
ncbi:hypothetical protein FRB94_009616 [Tulasnella sp. JGI-2019a]|nr:hypothetical protein FRB94_009616 [Tulasnella sp. JGI-2019a]KAG9017756.1 hypothetical protein FRB93_004567 [Tulasnella sp. JGI-2019a]KAG9035825.1 hypothetical protein FRB95_010419 [Tulasnella sp. JGI-2019a]